MPYKPLRTRGGGAGVKTIYVEVPVSDDEALHNQVRFSYLMDHPIPTDANTLVLSQDEIHSIPIDENFVVATVVANEIHPDPIPEDAIRISYDDTHPHPTDDQALILSNDDTHPVPTDDQLLTISNDDTHPYPIGEETLNVESGEDTTNPHPTDDQALILSNDDTHPVPTDDQLLTISNDDTHPVATDDQLLTISNDDTHPVATDDQALILSNDNTHPVATEDQLLTLSNDDTHPVATDDQALILSNDDTHPVATDDQALILSNDDTHPVATDDQALILSQDEVQDFPTTEEITTAKVWITETHPNQDEQTTASISPVSESHPPGVDDVNEICITLDAGGNSSSSTGDWDNNISNAEGLSDNVDATMTSTVLSASSGTLTLGYYNWNLSEINDITSATLTAYWSAGQSVSLGTITVDIEYRYGSGDSWKTIVSDSLGIIGSIGGPDTVDILPTLGDDWSKIDLLETRCVVNLPAGVGASAELDAIELDIEACTNSNIGAVLEQYSFTGVEDSFTVPDGVGFVRVDMSGAQSGIGGATVGDNSRKGGRLQGLLHVVPGETLYIGVAEKGEDAKTGTAGSGGFYDGGDGGSADGAGAGGMSYLKQDGTTDNDRVIVAGGAGGGAANQDTDNIDGTLREGGWTLDDENVTSNYSVAATSGGGGGGGWRGGRGGIGGSNNKGEGGTNMANTIKVEQIISTSNYQTGNGYVDLLYEQRETVIFEAANTGSETNWVVPDGVTWVHVDMAGAEGSSDSGVTNDPPGLGGRIQAIFNVSPGETLYISIGRAATDADSNNGGIGGFVDGANGGYGDPGTTWGGGAGGGESNIKQGGNTRFDRILVAGGGGGAHNGNSNRRGENGGHTLDDENVTQVLATNGAGTSGTGNKGAGGGAGWRGGAGTPENASVSAGGGTNMAHSTKTRGVISTAGYQTGDGYVKITYPNKPLTQIDFTAIGSETSWVVPNNVMELYVDMAGGEGGPNSTDGAARGAGGRIRSVLSVEPGETLYFGVGGVGDVINGGFYDSGNGFDVAAGVDGGGGGGQSYISKSSSAGDRILVAGGGGGAQTNFSGQNGGVLLDDESITPISATDGISSNSGTAGGGGGGGGWRGGAGGKASEGPQAKGGSNMAHSKYNRCVTSTAGYQTGDGYITIKY